MSRAALVLVIIGALNWFLVGLFGWDLIAAITGTAETTMHTDNMVARILYTIVGLAGIYAIGWLFNDRTPARDE